MTTYALPKMDAQCSKPKGLLEVQDPCAAESVSTSQTVVLYSTWVLAENYAFTHSVSEKDSLDLQYLHVYRNAQGVVGCTGKLMYQLSVACTFRKAHTGFEYLPLLDIVQGTTMASNSVNSSTGVYKPPSSAVETYYYQSCAAGIMNGSARYYFLQGVMGRKLLKRLSATWRSDPFEFTAGTKAMTFGLFVFYRKGEAVKAINAPSINLLNVGPQNPLARRRQIAGGYHKAVNHVRRSWMGLQPIEYDKDPLVAASKLSKLGELEIPFDYVCSSSKGGKKGGNALKATHGVQHFKRIGSKGGKVSGNALKATHGVQQ